MDGLTLNLSHSVKMIQHADFLAPKVTLQTLDRVTHRRALLAAVEGARRRFCGTLLDVGCGRQPYRALLEQPGGPVLYVGMDLAGHPNYGSQPSPELIWDGITIPTPNASFDCAMATEVLEHCPLPASVLAEIFRVLKPGGVFFFTVPFLWPLHDVPYDHYRYTPFALERLLQAAGFARIELRGLGGWDASLAQMMGLWARRRPMSRFARGVVSLLTWPLVAALTHRDVPPTTFMESQMITGISGMAWKA